MSEITPKFLNDYELAAEQAQVQLQKMRELAHCLPPDLPMPRKATTYGYCADLCMTLVLPAGTEQELSALAEKLMSAYKPLDAVYLPEQVTVKPREYLRGAEFQSVQREVYPVGFFVDAPEKAGGPDAPVKYTARWWTRLSAGVVEVLAEGVTPSMLGVSEQAYAPLMRNHGRQQLIYTRRLLKVPLGRIEVLAPWLGKLQEFLDTVPSPGARQVVNAVKSRLFLSSEEPVTLEMLTGSPSLKYNPFARLKPWLYLSEDKAEELVELSKQLAAGLEKALSQAKPAMQDAVNRAHDLVKELLSGYSQVADREMVLEVLQQKVSQQIGQGVEVCLFDYNKRSKALEARVMVQVSQYAPAIYTFKDVVCPCEPGKPVLKAMDLNPEFVPL